MVSIHGLHKRFGDRNVLNGIDLEIADGEILAVMGGSGGGKTTLLRCIAGLVAPTKGTIDVAGFDTVKFPEGARARMGMVFQSSALFDSMTVADNVAFGPSRLTKLKPAEIERRVRDTLDMVGLVDSIHLMPAELSGGMKKRVGMARALILEPSLLLYDEPTTGLDPISAYTIDRLIVDVGKNREVTSVVVSHDVASVLRVADRVAFLHEGVLSFLGTPKEFEKSDNEAIRELVFKATATDLTYDS